jgi:hypothetical protein
MTLGSGKRRLLVTEQAAGGGCVRSKRLVKVGEVQQEVCPHRGRGGGGHPGHLLRHHIYAQLLRHHLLSCCYTTPGEYFAWLHLHA